MVIWFFVLVHPTDLTKRAIVADLNLIYLQQEQEHCQPMVDFQQRQNFKERPKEENPSRNIYERSVEANDLHLQNLTYNGSVDGARDQEVQVRPLKYNAFN